MTKTYLLAAFTALGLLSGTAMAQELKVGTAGPMTGNNAAFGAQMRAGAEQAVADINAAGGVLGQKLVLSIGDDQSKGDQARSVANKMISDGVKFVVGHFNSGASIPASEAYNEGGVLQITPASTNEKYTDRGFWNTFRVCGRDDQQAIVASEYILKTFKGKKIALVNDKTTYGKGLADGVKMQLNKAGVTEAVNEAVDVGAKDFSALVTRLKASGVDVVFFGGLYQEAGLLIRQMRDQGVKAPLMGGDGLFASELGSIAGPGADGTLLTYGPDPRINPAAKDVVAKFTAKKVDPESYTLYTYAAFQVFKQAAEAAKSTDPKKVAEVMHSGTKFNTVMGPLSFDKKGDLTAGGFVVYEWKGGKFTQIP